MSERKADAAKRRDERATKGPEDEPSSGTRKHKDKKRWCKGKVGVEHTPVCVPYRRARLSLDEHNSWCELVCSTCGKTLATWMPFGSRKNNPKPDWVTS